MQFSLFFHLLTDRRKIIVLKSLVHDFDLREAHEETKRNEMFVLLMKEKFNSPGMQEICRCNLMETTFILSRHRHRTRISRA